VDISFENVIFSRFPDPSLVKIEGVDDLRPPASTLARRSLSFTVPSVRSAAAVVSVQKDEIIKKKWYSGGKPDRDSK
jgi:hypothetical protein